MQFPLYGLILNGGKSSRMGTAKGDLVVADMTLQQYMTQLLHSAGIDNVVVSGVDVADQFIEQGPLAGIEAVLSAKPNARWLVVPVDMPLLDEAVLRQLIQHGEMAHTCAHFARSVLPLYIASGDECLANIRACLKSNNHKHWSIRHWLASEQCRAVADPAGAVLGNINTPEQWQQFLANKTL
ncbi:molybdenum cofactor guanylyltransferase [Neiella marina]|uniref:Molybdenum cofactor guanylyltransferase n=1 Tax=Neiella marina TaxID=508461 RepID=A0A8J2U3N6_9GAMM|nr:molybdenum cofactor guanylyltransferase [Neiella marina]GGA70557.1 molybdenum cofactor guanylyltransferase [Neiella marina]